MTLDQIFLALWALLSLALGFLSPSALPASIASIAAFGLGLRKGMRALLALAVALQLPALVSVSLEQSFTLASTLMLASLYLAELADLAARAKRSRDPSFIRRKALQVTLVAALALPITVTVTAAAEMLTPVLSFGVAALVLAILVLGAISLKEISNI